MRRPSRIDQNIIPVMKLARLLAAALPSEPWALAKDVLADARAARRGGRVEALGDGYLYFVPYEYRWDGDDLQRLLSVRGDRNRIQKLIH